MPTAAEVSVLDVRRARMYNEHAKFLGKYNLNTTDDLQQHEQMVDAQISALCKERQALRNKLRWMKDTEKMQPIREEMRYPQGLSRCERNRKCARTFTSEAPLSQEPWSR